MGLSLQYQDVEIPFNPLPKDMHMMLWTAFQSNYMLGNMEEQVAKRMLNSMQMMEFGPGDVLLEQGALSRNMFILVKCVLTLINLLYGHANP